jgi:hypothetical protein
MRRSIAAAAALASLALSSAAVACPLPEQGFRRRTWESGELAYRLEPGQLRVGQFFAVDVIVCPAQGAPPIRPASIVATMPAHGHGMNYRPSMERIAPDRYRFTGLMLHMPGRWLMSFGFTQGDKGKLIIEPIDLAP